MKICEHLISDDQIIGIGPLMVKSSSSQAESTLYNSKKLFFELHLLHRSISIESDWLRLGYSNSTNEDEVKARTKYQEFVDKHKNAEKRISRLIKHKDDNATD